MSKPDAVAAILWAGITLYAVFAGADFGAGVWTLLAGKGKDGDTARRRIERSLAPVWEANHVWLIFSLVVLWTGFPEAFAAVTSTLYIPLALALVGIVLRGSGFAFSHVLEGRGLGTANRVFALSSLITPFFMGTVVGAIVDGEVPAEGNGDPTGSWIGPLPFLIGAMFVLTCAYVAAVFLISDAEKDGEPDVVRYFARRAIAAALVSGALAAVGLYVLDEDAQFVFDGLTGPALPLLIASVVSGVAVLALLVRKRYRGVRPLAVGAVVAMIWGWGVGQHPYLLPQTLTIDQAAAPDATLTAILIVFVIAALTVGPSLALLYALSERGKLDQG